jgi:hypothetical protein
MDGEILRSVEYCNQPGLLLNSGWRGPASHRSALVISTITYPYPYPSHHYSYTPPSCPLRRHRPHNRAMTTLPVIPSPHHRITPFPTTVSTSYSAIQRNSLSSLSRADLSVQSLTSICVCSKWPSITPAKIRISK